MYVNESREFITLIYLILEANLKQTAPPSLTRRPSRNIDFWVLLASHEGPFRAQRDELVCFFMNTNVPLTGLEPSLSKVISRGGPARETTQGSGQEPKGHACRSPMPGPSILGHQ